MKKRSSSDPRVWEQRWHPFREEWILFTSHRASRPWMGETKPFEEKPEPSYDPVCYLCPGNERVAGRNPGLQRRLRVHERPSDVCTGCAGSGVRRRALPLLAGARHGGSRLLHAGSLEDVR